MALTLINSIEIAIYCLFQESFIEAISRLPWQEVYSIEMRSQIPILIVLRLSLPN